MIPHVLLLVGLAAGAPYQVHLLPSGLPANVADAVYEPEHDRLWLTVRNEEPTPVIAWSVEAIWHYADGGTSQEGLSVDCYEQAAGLADAPRDDRPLAQGESMRGRLHTARRDGKLPEAVDLRVRAVVLEGNVGRGADGPISRFFTTRAEEASAWEEILGRLRATQAPDEAQLLARASKALEPFLSENNRKGSAAHRLFYRIRNAQEAGEDPRTAFAGLVSAAEAHVDAARRFAAPGAGR